MGYSTDFTGEFSLSKKLNDVQRIYLNKFAYSRHMKRDLNKLPNNKVYDQARVDVGLPYGEEGEFVVNDDGYCGQTKEPSIVDFNQPPCTQPGLWCQWVPNEDGSRIKWDGHEKFTDYIEWLEYLIGAFFEPWGIKLNGIVYFQGEDHEDRGYIQITQSVIGVEYEEVVSSDDANW